MNNRESIREKSIVIIGFMGVGKTTVGELVAKKLYRDFIDIDRVIENSFNIPIVDVFKLIGEKSFRQKEKEIIKEYCAQKLKVISLGGGAYLQEDIRKVTLENCIVIFLDITWESWKERLNIIIDSRPVLHGKTMEEIEELFYKRQGIYKSHHSKLETDNLNTIDIADFIVESLKIAYEMYDPN
ncbi:shikimate kinase [Neobacillus ginsengisoli]|uniref:Shikimate kinase n=1 Tax=Neobacillus ginsengisoli TaxID=904295 RepID=A0ABT9Y046_9BACI|nr:shikimate kinase [Neobacillus ginsengisoli]MDQ0201190.1 shikimate kinase [Neobacillus ginsengisoli]